MKEEVKQVRQKKKLTKFKSEQSSKKKEEEQSPSIMTDSSQVHMVMRHYEMNEKNERVMTSVAQGSIFNKTKKGVLDTPAEDFEAYRLDDDSNTMYR